MQSLLGIAQAYIIQNILYEFEIRPEVNWYGIQVNSCQELKISENVIASWRLARTQKIAIDLTNSAYVVIRDNLIRGTAEVPMLFGIGVPTSVNNAKVLDNQFKDVTNRISGAADGANVLIKNTYGTFKGSLAVSASSDVNVTVNHTLGIVPDIDKVQFSVRATSGSMDCIPMQVGAVTSTTAIVKVRVQNLTTAGSVQASVYLEK